MTKSDHESRSLTGYAVIYEAESGRVGLRGLFGRDIQTKDLPNKAESRGDFLDIAFAFAQKRNCRIVLVSQSPRNPRLWRAFLASPAGENDSRDELDGMVAESLGKDPVDELTKVNPNHGG